MSWYYYPLIFATGVFLATSLFHLVRLIRLGPGRDYAPSAGQTAQGIQYAFTGAMNPSKKESALFHLPTYTAGILYHLGTFLSIFIFFLILAKVSFTGITAILISGFLIITGICGIGILVKRMIKKVLRSLSGPDDYISNMLVTLFQFITSLVILIPSVMPGYIIMASLLLFYFPAGKLKHALYFFAARYHLGLFFGRRGVWPPKPM